MVNNCCVCGCTNYVGKKPGLRFFRFPLLDKERNAKWISAVRRVNWMPIYEAYKDLWRALCDRLAGFNFTRQLLNI